MNDDTPGQPPGDDPAGDDRFLITEARRITPALTAGSDRERLAAELLRQLADRLEQITGGAQ